MNILFESEVRLVEGAEAGGLRVLRCTSDAVYLLGAGGGGELYIERHVPLMLVQGATAYGGGVLGIAAVGEGRLLLELPAGGLRGFRRFLAAGPEGPPLALAEAPGSPPGAPDPPGQRLPPLADRARVRCLDARAPAPNGQVPWAAWCSSPYSPAALPACALPGPLLAHLEAAHCRRIRAQAKWLGPVAVHPAAGAAYAATLLVTTSRVMLITDNDQGIQIAHQFVLLSITEIQTRLDTQQLKFSFFNDELPWLQLASTDAPRDQRLIETLIQTLSYIAAYHGLNISIRHSEHAYKTHTETQLSCVSIPKSTEHQSLLSQCRFISTHDYFVRVTR